MSERKEPSVEELLRVDDAPGPARPLPRDDAAALVDRVLAESAGGGRQQGRPLPRGMMWLGLAAIVVSSVAVAASLRIAATDEETEAPEAPETTDADEATEESEASRSGWLRAVPIEPSADQAPGQDPGEEALPTPEPAPSANRETAPPRAPPSATEPTTAPDLLAHANALRAEGRWAEAAAAYGRIAGAGNAQDEGYVASVSAAELELVHLHAPRRALQLYRSALSARPDGALAPDCRLGLARAHRALGDAEAEQRVLEEFLRAHADSPLVTQVERRLADMTAEEHE